MRRSFKQLRWLNPIIRNYSVLDCSSIAGMYNDGSINIIYENGNLHVQIRNSSKSIVGKVKPSCEGSIIFGDNEQKTFEFNEKNKQIVWYGRRAVNKWIKGCFSDVIHIFFFFHTV